MDVTTDPEASAKLQSYFCARTPCTLTVEGKTTSEEIKRSGDVIDTYLSEWGLDDCETVVARVTNDKVLNFSKTVL